MPQVVLLGLCAIAGSAGGVGSMLLAGMSQEFMLGGQPAELTTLGRGQLCLFGAVCGAFCGVAPGVWVMCQRSKRQMIYAIAIAVALLLGALGPIFLMPIHLPLDLRNR